MHKKRFNSIDLIIENLSKGFSTIKDFNKVQETEEGRKLFNLIIKTTSDLENLESLFLNYYVPASNKSISDTWNEISRSKYKNLLNLSKADLKDNYYETIRLGYVGLFHKYESYRRSLIETANFLFKDLQEENGLENIENYCKSEFGINIYRCHNLFPITEKVNYISNCVKHKDGYPIKEPIHKDFIAYPENKKIEIEKEIFKIDIQRMKIHCESFLTQIMTIGLRQFMELDYDIIKKSLKPELLESPDVKMEIIKIRMNFNLVLSDFRK